MDATPQRATARSSTMDTTPSSSARAITAPWTTTSPQTPTTFVYAGPARASSTVLPSPLKDDSPQSRSRWTEHIDRTIPEDSMAEDGDEDEPTIITPAAERTPSGLPLPPAAVESLARIQRSSLPAPFDLTDPALRDTDEEQDDTVRPDLGRVATTRSVRIMQPRPSQPSQRPTHLQVPRQSYTAPESRGTTPMPMRPASQLGLVTYGGRPRIPRFNAPGLDLKLTREPGVWARVQWRIGVPLLVFGPIVAQLFFDFCTVYAAVQAAAEPTLGQTSSQRNWSLAAAAYCACVLIWLVGVIIIYEVVYLFWRRWRVKRPPIVPIYLSTPARHLASLISYDVFCFFRYVRRTAWDADAHDYVYDDRVMGRDGAEGRIGNRSKEMLGGRSAGQSREMLGHSRERSGETGKEHRRSDSGGMLMQTRESEDWKGQSADEAARSSGLGRTGEGGMRRRSVGRSAGDEVRLSLSKDSPTSPDTPGAKPTHRRSVSASGQTRFQELVRGPEHPTSTAGSLRDKSKFAHRRSMSGRTSSEVERQLEITPTPSRRIPSGSSGESSVGRVVSWVKAFRGKEPPTEKRDQDSPSTVRHPSANRRWTTDGLAEWLYARAQSGPAVSTLVPRAGIAAALLFSFWEPQTVGGVGTGARDGTFFRTNGTLTGFARGVLLANVVWVLARALLVFGSMIGLWVLSGQMCAGLCGPRYRWEEPTDEDEWEREKEEGWGEPRDKLNWEWRTAARERVQDGFELCMVRRRSSWRASHPLTFAPDAPAPAPRIDGPEKPKGKEPMRPPMDTFGSTFGAGVVRERNSDQELALSGLREEDTRVPLLEVAEDEPVGSPAPRRGILTAEMFNAPTGGFVGGFVAPSTGVAPTMTTLVPPAAALRSTTPTTGLVPLVPAVTSGPVTLLPFPLQPAMPVLPSPLVAAVRKGSAGRLTPPTPGMPSTSGSRSTPSAPGTSISGSTPTGPSTSTLVPMMTPRAGAARLESLSSRAGESVAETEEFETEGEGDQSFGQSAEHSFSPSGEHSGSGDRSYDSYADNFSVGDYTHSQESVRIHAPAAGSEADTSGSYSEGIDTSGSLSSLGQPISSRFFPIAFPRPTEGSSGSAGNRGSGSGGHRGSGSNGGGMSNLESPVSSNNRSSGAGVRHQASVISQEQDSILSHGRDSIISHVPRTPTSTISRAHDSIVSRGQDSLISSPSPSARSGLIPPPPHNPNQRRRRAGTAPSIASASSHESLGVLRRRVGSHTFGPTEFGVRQDHSSDMENIEGFEAEQEDSVGMLSTPSSRKNSLAAMSQRGARRGRVSSGSGSGSQSGSGSARSRAVSANYSLSVSGSGSGSGASVRRGSHSLHSEDEERDHTFGIGPAMWRRGSAQLPATEDQNATEPPVPAGPSQTATAQPDQVPTTSDSMPLPTSEER